MARPGDGAVGRLARRRSLTCRFAKRSRFRTGTHAAASSEYGWKETNETVTYVRRIRRRRLRPACMPEKEAVGPAPARLFRHTGSGRTFWRRGKACAVRRVRIVAWRRCAIRFAYRRAPDSGQWRMLTRSCQRSSNEMRIRRRRPFLPRALRLAMVDHATSERRCGIMRSVGQKDAGAELTVRRAPPGCRYRPRRRDLPGNPRAAFPSRRKTVFVVVETAGAEARRLTRSELIHILEIADIFPALEA